MGAWDIGSFSNDDALDWVLELQDEDDFEILEDSFSTILDQKGTSPDAPDCCVAVAAGEVLAALVGNPMEDLPGEVGDWAAGKTPPKVQLIQQAREALEIVLGESELKDLWEETDQFSAWSQEIKALLGRLA